MANDCRVMFFDWLTPETVYDSTPALALPNVSVTVPTSVFETCAGFQGEALNGTELNAGPVVR